MTHHHALQLRASLSRAARRSVRYRGMLVLVIWQAPIQPVIRPNGSIGILIGAGSDEHAELSCNGDVIRADQVKYQVAAVEADFDLSPGVRIDAVAGVMRSDVDSYSDPFATLQVRGDWRRVGLGGGIAISPGFGLYNVGPAAVPVDGLETRYVVWPSVYARGGSAEGLHLRADLFPPNAFAGQQAARLGLGYNAVARDRASAFIGIAAVGADGDMAGIAGDIAVPVADRFALRLQGYYADGHEYPIGGLAVGGRVLLGGRSASVSSRQVP